MFDRVDPSKRMVAQCTSTYIHGCWRRWIRAASVPFRHGRADLRKTSGWDCVRLRRIRRVFASLNPVRKFESCRERWAL